jgi:ABC-type transporter Mla maintaining outer membrane lipid asymmetry ATPase subunit MlaF
MGNEGEVVFDGLSCDLPVDSVVWLRASSGGGKSHLMRLIAGLEEPDYGAYLINGEDVSILNFAQFSRWQRRIGFGFEFGGLLSNKTVEQNLMLPFFYHRHLSTAEAEARVSESLEHFGLMRFKDRRPAACSGGNRKSAVLARALVTWPELLLLDHPTAGLDEKGVQRLQSLIELHRRERGLRHIYIASEDEKFMAGLKDHVRLDMAELRNAGRKEIA